MTSSRTGRSIWPSKSTRRSPAAPETSPRSIISAASTAFTSRPTSLCTETGCGRSAFRRSTRHSIARRGKKRRHGRRARLRSVARAQELAGNDHPLDLGRAFANRAELHVTVELFGREVLREAVSAMDLHGEIRHAHGDLRGVELRHRGLFRRDATLAL